jgi:hypothetical protein
MSGGLGFVVIVLIFVWFFLCCPITSDMQLFSPSHYSSISPQFRVLSIDRIINLSQSVQLSLSVEES